MGPPNLELWFFKKKIQSFSKSHPERCDFYARLLSDPITVGQKLAVSMSKYLERVAGIAPRSTVDVYFATPTKNLKFAKNMVESFKSVTKNSLNDKYYYKFHTAETVLKGV